MLLIAEALGASGFLLGAAVAAFVSAAIAWALPELGVGMQLGVYAAVSVVATYVYFQFFREMERDEGNPRLNRGARKLIGSRFVLHQDVPADEEIRVQIGDTMWRVRSDSSITSGQHVEVVDAGRMSLSIAPVE